MMIASTNAAVIDSRRDTPASAVPPPVICSADGLDRQLANAFVGMRDAKPAASRQELERATFAFVWRSRLDGSAPEQTLVAIKRALAGPGGQYPSLDGRQLSSRDQGSLYQRVFCWFLDAYFDDGWGDTADRGYLRRRLAPVRRGAAARLAADIFEGIEEGDRGMEME